MMYKQLFQTGFLPLLIMVALLIGSSSVICAQNTENKERYNLAVYATGTQNDHVLPISLQTVIQNKTITKLTADGNYRLIERSAEFLKQIQNEQTMQQSGDVADGQIAEIGAGYGAQKICVVSVTIIDKYLYIATRIVDVATKTSFESGDAEITNYNSIPVLTQTLETALSKMLTANINQASSASQQALNAGNGFGETYANYVRRVKKEKGAFLGENAYDEYRRYQVRKAWGNTFFVGPPLIIGGIAFADGGEELLSACFCIVGVSTTVLGIWGLCTKNKHLHKSYRYYINGDQKTATLDFHPYFGINDNTMGMGLTLRF